MKSHLLLTILVLLVIISKAQIVNIPDTVFKAALVAHIPVIDSNGDGEIQVSEASAFTDKLDITPDFFFLCITDMTGLEAFINITILDCSFNYISILDVSSNQALQHLCCQGSSGGSGQMGIDSLVISNNTALTYLDCGGNYITSLDLSNNINLDTLICAGNSISSLDVSNNIGLLFLDCTNDSISTLDVSNNTALIYLNCSSNQLSNLDLSNHTVLNSLGCYSNQLTSLNVKNGNNINFTEFRAYNNPNLYCIEVDDTVYSVNNWHNIDAQSYFNEDCTTSIDEEVQTNELTVSPNPFSGQLLIMFEKESAYQIRILDLLGKEVFSTNVSGRRYSISTSELPVGTYLLKVISEDNIEIKKIIKY